ncbi:hypothetical protein SKAU_G00220670 [Synaphobranchus kaupii]|uniref:Uncharacterized protein n=1 Tax=Synaphobranchus kaupii TaxID=118154 RepID=A0A9Q1FAW3_SYNKA|nr:hypothetical protein SKAU_G00220670 [Synaphobranchus kaupii]
MILKNYPGSTSKPPGTDAENHRKSCLAYCGQNHQQITGQPFTHRTRVFTPAKLGDSSGVRVFSAVLRAPLSPQDKMPSEGPLKRKVQSPYLSERVEQVTFWRSEPCRWSSPEEPNEFAPTFTQVRLPQNEE